MSDYHSDSFRESLLRLDHTPRRVTQDSDLPDPELHASLRKLSRARVALTLRQLRAALGLSYAQVQTDTGLSQQLLFDMEFGERRLTLHELNVLAECYNVSINDILGVTIE
jgi:hypothetical protein